MSIDLSVIIATRNSEEFIASCLMSLMTEEARSAEIIAVDNASTDRTVETIRARFPQVRVLVNGSNTGHCRATNRGLSAAQGSYFLVMDADTVVLPGTLPRLLAFLREHDDVAVVAPRMLNPDGSLQETARRFPTVAAALFGRQTILTRLFPNNRFSRAYLQRDKHGEISPFEVDWVSAACMAFPRALVERLGPWDEGFGGYWVDADWCARARTIGRIFCLPAGRVIHAEQNRPDRRKGTGRIVQFHRGVYRFYRKHYTRGMFDPRALAAAVGLSLRAALLVLIDLARLSAGRSQRFDAASAESAATAAIAKNQQ